MRQSETKSTTSLTKKEHVKMRIIKVCGVCGKEFVASVLTSKYCSRRCERVAFRKRESEKKKNEKESVEALRKYSAS